MDRQSPGAPTVVEVTVVAGPRRQRPVVPRRRLAVLGALVAAIAAGVLAGLHLAGAHSAARPRAAVVSAPSPEANATLMKQLRTAYRYPQTCVNVAIFGAVAREAAGHTARLRPCSHDGVYVTAVLREAGGVWRLALSASPRACPGVRLPPSVRAQLVVCQAVSPTRARAAPRPSAR